MSKDWGDSLEELKAAAGDPTPYRLSVATFWWAGGTYALLARGPRFSTGAVTIFVLAFTAGGFFYYRLLRRQVITEFVFLWIARPRVGLPFMGWLLFGNPIGSPPIGKFLFLACSTGLVFASYAFLFGANL